jgi:hypothetical protein
LTASMCLRITSLALGICSPIVVGGAILSKSRTFASDEKRKCSDPGTFLTLAGEQAPPPERVARGRG